MNKNNPADRLRIIRKSKGWSLQDVERNSNGKWKAVVIGSYERADRAISLKKAISLMDFYQVPVSELFPDIPPQVSTRSIALDLVKLSAEQSEYSSKRNQCGHKPSLKSDYCSILLAWQSLAIGHPKPFEYLANSQDSTYLGRWFDGKSTNLNRSTPTK